MNPRRIMEGLIKRYGARAVMGLAVVLEKEMQENEETPAERIDRQEGAYVERILKRKGQVHHSDLLRKVSSRGITTGKLKDIIDIMVERGWVKIFRDKVPGKTGAVPTVYKWIA